MAKILSTHILASAPTGASAPDSITYGGGSLWVEYGDGASSTGGQTSTIVEYSLHGQVEQTYTAAGLADGLKFNPATGDVWVLDNNDGNASLQLIDPATKQISTPLTYGAPYVYGADSGRGYDDVVFDKGRVFMSYTNPTNPGDPVVQQLLNGNAPFGTLHTSTLLSYGDTGTNLVTGQLAALPMSDPDSLKLLPNGSLVLTSEADHSLIFINHPGAVDQTASFVTLPTGDTPDDAIMTNATSGTFFISNEGANNVVAAQVSGLNPHDLYVDIYSQNELAQLDPTTGQVTPILTGLNNPHGLAFIAAPASPAASATSAPTAGGTAGSSASPAILATSSTTASSIAPSPAAATSGPATAGPDLAPTSQLGQLPVAMSGADQMAAQSFTPAVTQPPTFAGSALSDGMTPGAAISAMLPGHQGGAETLFPAAYGSGQA